MTAPTTSPAHHDGQSPPAWADDLATYLGPAAFPAAHDQLAATLIQRHAPSHLLWLLATAPRHREFQSLDELVAQIGRSTTVPPGALEPS